MNSTVFFANLRADAKTSLLKKIERLLTRLDLKEKSQRIISSPSKSTSARGGTRLRASPLREEDRRGVRKTGGQAFSDDTNTLYVGSRGESISHLENAFANGFQLEAVGAPVIIGGGLRGNRCLPVEVNLPHFRSVEISPELVDADTIIRVTHFKGHEMSGFGGTLKNFGMGSASRQGKLSMHSLAGPYIQETHARAVPPVSAGAAMAP